MKPFNSSIIIEHENMLMHTNDTIPHITTFNMNVLNDAACQQMNMHVLRNYIIFPWKR